MTNLPVTLHSNTPAIIPFLSTTRFHRQYPHATLTQAVFAEPARLYAFLGTASDTIQPEKQQQAHRTRTAAQYVQHLPRTNAIYFPSNEKQTSGQVIAAQTRKDGQQNRQTETASCRLTMMTGSEKEQKCMLHCFCFRQAMRLASSSPSSQTGRTHSTTSGQTNQQQKIQLLWPQVLCP